MSFPYITTILCMMMVLFFKQKTAYEVRISDWSSDVCSSDLFDRGHRALVRRPRVRTAAARRAPRPQRPAQIGRASCRARVRQYVEISVVAVSLKKTARTTRIRALAVAH